MLLFLAFALIIVSALMIRYSHLINRTSYKVLLYFGSAIPVSTSSAILNAMGIDFVVIGLCVFIASLVVTFIKIN